MTDSGGSHDRTEALVPVSAPRGRGPHLTRHCWTLLSICHPHSLPSLPALCICKLSVTAECNSCFLNSTPHHETLPIMKMRPCWAGLTTVSVHTCSQYSSSSFAA